MSEPVELPATDRALLERLRAGEHEALHVIFRSHHERLVGFAQSIVGERASAEDVVQDVFLELWKRREQLIVDTSLVGYLMRSARNRALNQLRPGRRERSEMAAPTQASPSTAHRDLVEKEIAEAVAGAMAELPQRCREVFDLSRTHGLKYAEIAQVLGISIKSVETHIGRALKTMRLRLRPWMPEADL